MLWSLTTIPGKLDSKEEGHLLFGSIISLKATPIEWEQTFVRILKNVGLISESWSKFLSRVSYKIKQSDSDHEAAKWTMGGSYFCFSYVCSLRGEEGFLLDIKKLREH